MWTSVHTPAEPSEAVRAADRLLRELPPSPRREVLACYTLMAYKGRSQIDKAAGMLIELLAAEKEKAIANRKRMREGGAAQVPGCRQRAWRSKSERPQSYHQRDSPHGPCQRACAHAVASVSCAKS